MSTWTFYQSATGLLVGRTFSGPAEDLPANTPADCSAIEGHFDHLCQRVDLEAGLVVDYQPPAPAADVFTDWAWDEVTRRWLAVPTLAAVAAQARTERDRRLSACDWVVSRAAEAGSPVPEPWRAYRQALRDVTQQTTFPTAITWPEPPA